MTTTSDSLRPVIDVVGVRASYPTTSGRLPVLDTVDLRVDSGEVVAVVGPSGCGKTTLLRAVQGLAPVDAGSIAVSGRAPGAKGVETGYAFQQPLLYPWWTVRRNVEFGLRLTARKRVATADRRERVDRLIELVGLAGFEAFRPAALSGGMQQRVNLARALAIDPAVLLLDEPFSAVDTLTRERLQRVLADTLTTLGTAAVLVTHDIDEAVFLADRVAVMSERPGRIVATFDIDPLGPRDEEFQHSERLATMSRRIYETLKAGDERAERSRRTALTSKVDH